MIARLFRRLAHCANGVMAIEVALVAPVLLILAVGAFEATSLVTRQHELQSAAAEAESIAMTASSGVETRVDTIKSIIKTSLNLTDDQVNLTVKFRCGTDTALTAIVDGTDTAAACGTKTVSKYLEIELTDSYEPVWTLWGLGKAQDYNILRTVQVS